MSRVVKDLHVSRVQGQSQLHVDATDFDSEPFMRDGTDDSCSCEVQKSSWWCQDKRCLFK